MDRLADTELANLPPGAPDWLSDELEALTGIGLSYENFEDFHLCLYDPNPARSQYVHWPIPALRTVREVRELCERMHAATIKPTN